MAHKKSREQIHKNMSRVRNSDTALEKLLCGELVRHGVTTFTRNNKTIFGKPDIVFFARKIAIFCDGDFSPFSRIEQLTFVLASAAFVAALNLQDSLSMYFLRKLTSTLVKHTNIYMGTIPKTI